jgi:hypothetical protein
LKVAASLFPLAIFFWFLYALNDGHGSAAWTKRPVCARIKFHEQQILRGTCRRFFGSGAFYRAAFQPVKKASAPEGD